MSTAQPAAPQPKNEGTIKAGNGEFIYKLPELARREAGRGYSSATKRSR